MFITYLADRPEVLSAAAAWLADGWALELDAARELLRGRCRKDELPLTLLAFEGETPVGMASLIHDVAPDPWVPVVCLAGVFVETGWRQRGVGAALCRRAIDEACRLGLDALHLYTPDRVAFYTRLGWAKLADTVVATGRELQIVAFLELRLDEPLKVLAFRATRKGDSDPLFA